MTRPVLNFCPVCREAFQVNGPDRYLFLDHLDSHRRRCLCCEASGTTTGSCVCGHPNCPSS